MIKIIEMAFFLSLLLTLGSLFFGLYTYFKGGELHKKFSNAAMRWRIIFQALSLALFFLVLFLKN